MRQAPPELQTASIQHTESGGIFAAIERMTGDVTRKVRNFSAGIAVTLGSLTAAQEAPAQTYPETIEMARKLGTAFYPEREKTSLKIKKLCEDPEVAHKMMVWMAPEKDGGVLERTRRLEAIEEEQWPKSVGRYPVKFDDDWIDGANYHPKSCDVRLPQLWSGAEFLSNHQISNLYMQKAERRKIEATGSPTWKRYSGALQILSEELRDYYARGELWNPDARKAFDDWNAKNPTGDKGRWLLDRFDDRMENGVLPKIEKTLAPFKEGSEIYRKQNNLPLKRPMGPLLRDIRPADTIPVVSVRKKAA